VWEVDGGRITPFACTYTEYERRAARGERPEPFPLHTDDSPRRRRPDRGHSQGAEKKAAPEAAAKVEIDWGGGGGGDVRRRKTKAQKREEAEARRQQAGRTKGLRKKIEAAEARIAELEQAIESLRAQQADSAHYDDPARVMKVARTVGQTEKSLAEAYAEWEQLSAAFEAAEAAE
jgi:hypothetical protein